MSIIFVVKTICNNLYSDRVCKGENFYPCNLRYPLNLFRKNQDISKRSGLIDRYVNYVND